VTFSFSRLWAGQGVGESSIFAPTDAAFTVADDTAPIDITSDGLDELRYTNTHHNWNDELEVWVDDLVVRWSVEVDLDGPEPFVYTVSATRDGASVLPATNVFPL
jgi:hypothetical protein